MSDQQKPARPETPGKNRDDRQVRLAEALRANLRRRKAAPPSPSPADRGGTDGDA